MRFFASLTFFLGFSTTILMGQKPDFYQDSLYVVSGREHIQHKADIKAAVKIYCDGEYVTMVIDVKDDIIENKPDALETDHVEVWLALPPSAYSRDFEYNFHPKYIYAPGQTSAYEKSTPPRFFSVYSEYSSQLGLSNFVKDFDYPTSKDIKSKGLTIPAPENLKSCRIDYGMVQYGFYPDQRPCIHLNQANYSMLESLWQTKMGDFTQGVKYIVDKTAQGYTLNIQFSAQALGFAMLPKMEELRVRVDIFDKDGQGRSTTSNLSTSQFFTTHSPISFNTVRFRRPLKTNSTDIPDAVFSKLKINPVYTFLQDGWTSTDIETDMVALQPEAFSKSLIELKFQKQPIRYTAYQDAGGNAVKKLSIDKSGVNTKPKALEYYLVNGVVFESEIFKMGRQKRESLNNHTFAFPDGTAGLILKNRTPQNAYGWGACKDCYEEVISFMRIKGSTSQTIFVVYQGNSGNSYCQIGGTNYKGYYVYGLDWLREGKIAVLRLSSWDNALKKRVKVSWNDDGSKIAMQEL